MEFSETMRGLAFRTTTATLTATVLTTAMAASAAERSVDISTEVLLGATDVELSGLQNISPKLELIPAAGILEDAQTFCLFSPTRLFNMTWRGAVKDAEGLNRFFVEDLSQPNGELDQLNYSIRLRQAFNGDGAIGSGPGGGFQNGVTQNGIDSGSFNTDKTCSDGDNVELIWGMSFQPEGPGGTGPAFSNVAVLEQLVDGRSHFYTDTLTVIVEPSI